MVNFKNFFTHYSMWIKLILVLFVISGILGVVGAYKYPELMDKVSEAFAEEFGESPDLNLNLAFKIFIQNATASLIAWLGGLLVGLAPILVVVANGFLIGYVVTYIYISSSSVGDSITLVIAGLLPHGVFELPAVLLAAVLGMKLGWDWLSDNAKGARLVVLKQSFINTAKYFVFVILGLAIAAIVEVYVSGKLVNNL
jgi:stage II sporulation protein M